jgi:diacylglycerol kinase (ATP)
MKRLQGVDYVKEHYRTSDMRVVICGGDGTVLWVIQEITDANIDTNYVTFGIIPIGTGNDFSRTLGWGSSSPTFSEDNINELSKLVNTWMQA